MDVGSTPATRSRTPARLGVWSVVLGAVGTLFSVFAIVRDGPSRMMVKAAGDHLELIDQFRADTHAFWTVDASLMCAFSVALVWIGIGQVRYMRWTARASRLWAIAGLVYLVQDAITYWTVYVPALARFAAETTTFHASSPWLVVPLLVVQASYPIVLLRAFRQRHVVSAMDRPLPPPLPTAIIV